MTQLTRFLKIRVSKDQYERLLNNATSQNYKTISQYIREATLGKGFFTEKLISENNKMLKEILNILEGWKK